MGLFNWNKDKKEIKEDELTKEEFNAIRNKFTTKRDKLIIDKFILMVSDKMEEKKKKVK